MINALLVLTPTPTLNPAEQDTVFSLTKVVYSNRKEGEEEATCIWYQTMPWAPAGSSHILPCLAWLKPLCGLVFTSPNNQKVCSLART